MSFSINSIENSNNSKHEKILKMKKALSNITTFAPVIIPTLCRSQHFISCIESLMVCKWAENTDVYIGLDYPSKESHWEGYNKILIYLNKLKVNHKFKSLNIIKRERNYGLGTNGNLHNLRNLIFEKYDRLIVSEDDNIFSPAFLDFMNKALERYKTDYSIIAINAYTHFFDFKCAPSDTVFYENYNYSAWGSGFWRDRVSEFNKISPSWFRSKGILKCCYRIAKDYGWERTLDYLIRINTNDINFSVTDIALTLYMIIENKYVVVPKISLVKNIGIDKSGENFKNVSPEESLNYTKQTIFMGDTYPLIKKGQDYFKINNKIFEKNSISKKNLFEFSKKLSKYLIDRLSKKIHNI